MYRRAAIFDGWVDAINATDGSGANCHMSSVGVCSLLTRVGYAPVMQVSCRDKNRIAIQGDVLGGAAMGVANVLCLTGDGVQCGDQPEAKPVFDLDSRRSDRDHPDHARRGPAPVRPVRSAQPPELFIGAAENPFAPPYDFRPLRLAKKIAAGAQFIQTQYCYDIPTLERFMARARDLGLHEKCFILVGVGPLASARAARWIREHVPGVHIPDAVIERIERAPKQREEGKRICIELIQQIREIEGVAGIHLMAYRQEESVAEIIERSNVLRGRRPHNVIARWAAFQKWRAAAHAAPA